MNKPPIYLFSLSSVSGVNSIKSLDITFFDKNIDFNAYDYLIITSKQVSEYFKHFHITPPLPALAISKASAKSYEVLGGKVLEVGKGYGDTLESVVKKYPKSTKWLYLRAEVIASDFTQKLREDGFLVDEEIIYKSECSQTILNASIPKEATLIFTSPSSIECFLQKHTILPSHKVIVIGKTTAKALPFGVEYLLAPTPTIKSCLEIA